MADTKPKHDMDERVKLPLDPELAIRALLQVDPNSEPAAADQWCPETWMGKQCILRAGHESEHQYSR